MLPGALLRNRDLKFVCRDVELRTETANSPFTSRLHEGQTFHVPVAHGEGQYFADERTLDQLEAEDRVAFRYVDAAGLVTAEANPNGSLNNIAGVVNGRGNVLGMMPHPERAVGEVLGSTDGMGFFRSLADHLVRA